MKPEMYIQENEKNILLKEFFAERAEGYHTFWQDLCNKYPGWEVDFVYRNCEPPAQFMAEIGAKLIDSAIITELTKEHFNPAVEIDALLITADNFHMFAPIHDKANPAPEMFWTSERIAEKLDRWRIYMSGSNYVLMSLWGNESEIFALEVQNVNAGASLLSTTAQFAFGSGKQKMLYFVSDNMPIQYEAAQQVGFISCGKCATYQGVIRPLGTTQ